MNKSKPATIFLTFLFFFLVTLFFGYRDVSAQDTASYLTRSEWHADDALAHAKQSYICVSKVQVVIIPTKLKSNQNDEAMRSVYYYFATRSDAGDVPFHYAVTWDGRVYQGAKLGEESKVALDGGGNTLFIAYIPREGERISVSAIPSLTQIIAEVSSKQGAKPTTLDLKALILNRDDLDKVKKISLGKVSSVWNKDFALIKSAAIQDYEAPKVTYAAKVIDLGVPSKEQSVTKTANVTLKVKNTGNKAFCAGATEGLFFAKTSPFDSRSRFFISSEWVSPSRVELLAEGERLGVGEEKEITFKVYIPLYPPKYSEKFILVGPSNKQLSKTVSTLALKIAKPTQRVLEVSNTPSGFLNVRDKPGLGTIITKVSEGDRFLVLDYNAGYYKINANGKTGWVSATYIRIIAF